MIREKQHLLTNDQESIIALCTPRGSGAIALLRISGVDAIAVVDTFAKLSSGNSLASQASHTIHHGYVLGPVLENVDKAKAQVKHEIIDQVMFLLMRAPKTFTGQNTVEITAHNNQFIIEKIITRAIQAGARLAKPGEFSKRAFLHGKIDLVQAESINELIHAQTELALQKSLAQLSGSLSHVVQELDTQLTLLLGFVEASFEFLDEEQRDFSFDDVIKQKTEGLLASIREMKKNFSAQQQIKQGVRVAIVGIVNAGKSTLFNALLNQERAIVADLEGTTRDSIESTVYKKGNFMLFIDTAGLRSTSDVIEQQGIQRSFLEAAQADIILLVFDATRELNEQQEKLYRDLIAQHHEKVITVVNKIDCVGKSVINTLYDQAIHVSAQHKQGISELEALIEQKIQKLFQKLNSPFLLNQRQYALLAEIEARLDFVVKHYADGIHYELVAYQLKELLEKVSELTGKNVTEKLLDTVFNSFCVGK